METALLRSHPVRQPGRRLRCRLSLLLLAAALALISSTARADLADVHYKRALKLYETKAYPQAIREFQAAYRARQLPKILLLIGQVYRKLGMASTALKFYEHYLRVEPHPKPEVKAEVDRYIAVTRAMLDPPEFEAPPGTAPEPNRGARVRKPTAAEEAAAAVAAAPSNVTSVTVPELYIDENAADPSRSAARPLQPATDAGMAAVQPNPGTSPGGASNPTAATPPGPASTPQTASQPATTDPGAATSPALDLTRPAVPPEQSTPLYKKPWFWGAIAGGAAVIAIIGIAAGAGQTATPPPDILHPTK